jgi:hypothetical protein
MTIVPRSAVYRYFINLDERGSFSADVRNPRKRTIFEIHGFQIFEDGWMRHRRDLDGLKQYLVDLGLMNRDDDLAMGQ